MNLGDLLSGIPAQLRQELLSCFEQVIHNYYQKRWEPSELNGGKFCEVVYSILNGIVSGKYPAKSQKPKNMVDACNLLGQSDSNKFSRSIRIHIPRVLLSLYEIRNNRSVGHIGGDVDPNHMDAEFVVGSVKWVLAELIRTFHGTSTDEARSAIDGLVERKHPIIWEYGSIKRVLRPGMSMKNKTLILLYSTSGTVSERLVFEWSEHTNISVYRRDVVLPLHKEAMIHYDKVQRTLVITPVGMIHVEKNIPLVLS